MISVAPMMGYTDRYMRYLLRLIAKNVRLYTEMVPILALLRGKHAKALLDFDESEHPIALQLGGNDPQALARGARMGEEAGYDEVNLNVGCPSPRVHAGRFGACLMLEPHTVFDCVLAMKNAISIPVTLKCRIGVNEQNSFEMLSDFIGGCVAVGCDRIIVHARKAWLSGLSPKKNRCIPPLEYEKVYHLKKVFPALHIIINGGIQTLSDLHRHLQHVDGVMLGRKIQKDPYFLHEIEAAYYPTHSVSMQKTCSREAILNQFLAYIATRSQDHASLSIKLRPLFHLFQGQIHGGTVWRRILQKSILTQNLGNIQKQAARYFT